MSDRHGPGPALRLPAWAAALVVTARALLAAGRTTLSIPLTSADGLQAWVSDATPAEMAMGVLRLLAIAACAYLLAVTALGVLARLVRAQGLAAAVDRVSPALVRRVVSGGSGAGLVLGALVASAPVPDLADPPRAATVAAGAVAPPVPDVAAPGSATMARVPPGTVTMSRTPADPGAPTVTPDEATMTQLDAAESSATMRREPEPGAEAEPEPVAGAEPAAEAATAATPPPTQAAVAPIPSGPVLPTAPALPVADLTTWIVEPGDSLWSIAEDAVRTVEPGADDRRVTRYWRTLVEVNRPHLVDPGNPDLLVTGQRLEVPPVPG